MPDDKLIRTRPAAGGVDLFRSPEEAAQVEGLGESRVAPTGLAKQAAAAGRARRRAAFDTWGDALLTFAEGVTDAASLGLLHIPGEAADIRRDVNSGAALAGNIVGFVGGMVAGPEAAVAGIGRKAGERAARAVIGEAVAGSRAAIAAKTAGGAAEMAALMGATSVGHQLTDAILDDKDFSAAAAIHEAGLGAILGGGFSFLSGVFGRAASRFDIQSQGGLLDPASDTSKALADHVRDARAAWDQMLTVHEQRLGVLKQLEREGMLEGTYPEFMAAREQALATASKARARLDSLDFERALDGNARSWGDWAKAYDNYEASLRQLDDLMQARQIEHIQPVQPGQPLADPGAPLTENVGLPQQWVEQMDRMMADPARAAEYEALYGRPYEQQLPGSGLSAAPDNLGGQVSPTSGLGTPVEAGKANRAAQAVESVSTRPALPLPAEYPFEGPVYDAALATEGVTPLGSPPIPGRALPGGVTGAGVRRYSALGYGPLQGRASYSGMPKAGLEGYEATKLLPSRPPGLGRAGVRGYEATGLLTPEQAAARALEETGAIPEQAGLAGDFPPGWGPGTTPVQPVWQAENTAWYGPGEYGSARMVRENAENFARFQDMMRPTPVAPSAPTVPTVPTVPAEAAAVTTPVIPRPAPDMTTPVIARGSNAPTPVIPRGAPAGSMAPSAPIDSLRSPSEVRTTVHADNVVTPVSQRTDVVPVDGATTVSARERLRRSAAEVGKSEGSQAVRRYIDEWHAMADASGPRFSPGDYAADRIRSVMSQLQGATAGREIAAASTELATKLRLPLVRSTLGLTLNDIYVMRQLASVAADASKGVVTRGLRNSPMLDWILKRSAARIAGDTGRGMVKAVGGKLLGPLGYFTGSALVYSATGMFGRVAGAAGRLYQKSVKAAAALLRGRRAIYLARASAGTHPSTAAKNHPIAYSETGPIKDPVQRIEELRRVASSPATLADFVARASGDLNLVAPEFVSSTVAQVTAQLQFLLEMTPPARYDYLGRPVPPSAGALRKFLEAENAVFDLDGVLQAVSRGNVTSVQVEALRRAHAPVYTRIAAFLMEDPAKLETLERAKLKTVGMIVGVGMTPGADPAFVMRQQASWEPELPPGATLNPGAPGKAQALKIPGAGKPPSETQSPSAAPTPAQSYGVSGRAPGN